jgi:hypothetical protein
MFQEHPWFIVGGLGILASAVRELTKAAATKAIAERGTSRLATSPMTHLVFATSSDAHMPGADLRLASLLGLRSSVQRAPDETVCFRGCSSGSATLRAAKYISCSWPATELSANFFLRLVLPALGRGGRAEQKRRRSGGEATRGVESPSRVARCPGTRPRGRGWTVPPPFGPGVRQIRRVRHGF